jgi:hypothetical protein
MIISVSVGSVVVVDFITVFQNSLSQVKFTFRNHENVKACV